MKVAIKLLTKKFGVIPNEMQKKLQALNMDTLEAITEDIFHFETLDDVKKYLSELR